MNAQESTFISHYSGKSFGQSQKVSAQNLRPSLLNYIQTQKPDFTKDSLLSFSELSELREKYISDYLLKQVGELSDLELQVIQSIRNNQTITDKLDSDENEGLTLGQRIADKVASFGGSWAFIISFGFFLLAWIALNVFWYHNQGFDPFPFILLNLILSCLAAIQAPVIMMSQNRQEEKDRERSKKDYLINLKSELEIRALHEKMDHLLLNQQLHLMEIQKIQIEMMNDILQKLDENKTS